MGEATHIPVEVIKAFMIDVFRGLGVPEEDSRTCADVLITSDLRGIESHGVGRLKYYYDRIRLGVHRTVTEMEIVKETETTALVDGHHGMGHVIVDAVGAPQAQRARYAQEPLQAEGPQQHQPHGAQPRYAGRSFVPAPLGCGRTAPTMAEHHS